MDRGQSAGDGDTEVEERRRREGMKGRGSRDRWGGVSVPSRLTSDWCTTW